MHCALDAWKFDRYELGVPYKVQGKDELKSIMET